MTRFVSFGTNGGVTTVVNSDEVSSVHDVGGGFGSRHEGCTVMMKNGEKIYLASYCASAVMATLSAPIEGADTNGTR